MKKIKLPKIMIKDFLTIQRRNPEYREGRTKDFKDVEIRPDLGTVIAQANRCMGCGIAFCNAYGCPLGNNIPDFNRAVAENRLLEAYNILCTTSPFPEFTSRICPALCESACCAGLPSAPVTVKQIEFCIVENAFKNGWVKARKARFNSGKRVAVVGSGPAGLACADRLCQMGHEVCIFEKRRKAGGLLRYGIPNFKLEKQVIDRRMSLMMEAGVSFECDTEIGRDVSLDFLEKKFDAVCLCIGSEQPRDLKIPGRELSGIYFALDFLGSQMRHMSGESASPEICAKDKNVLVIGGGDTGSDCLGTAIRHGAKSVVQIEIMPEPPAERDASTPWPMWEYKKRTSSSHLEGGKRMWNVLSKEFIGSNSRVCALRAKRIKWSCENGRPKSFEEISGSDFEIPADLVLLSMGFSGICLGNLAGSRALELSKNNTLRVDACGQTSREKVFACGDAVNGASLVVRAIASGRELAEFVDKKLGRKIY